MRQKTPNRFVRHLALITLGISLASTSPTSQTDGITLAWDPNLEPVDGYMVHVGTRSGWYDEFYDAGPNTMFTYRSAAPGTLYYFAVSAYRSGRSSLPSLEVSGVLGGGPSPVYPRYSSPGRMSSNAAVTSTCPGADACYAVRVRASGLEPVTSLAPLPDNGLLVVEGGRRVRFVGAGGVIEAPALEAPDGRRIVDVAVGPDVAATGHVYIGVTHRGSGITLDYSILRYRYVHRRMGEAAVIVSGLPVANAQSPRMTLDRMGRIYVAMPAGDVTRRDPYAGMILRFNPDGTTPADAVAASPIMASGFEIPSGLAADAETIWAFGIDRRWAETIGRLEVTGAGDALAQWSPASSPGENPARSIAKHVIALSVSPEGTGGGQPSSLAYIDSEPQLHVARLPGAPQRVLLQDTTGDLVPDAVLVGPGHRIHVAARDGSGATLLLDLSLP